MEYNYHTHTHRCGHATGTEEEYIKKAIEGGIKYMGFSDHIPFMCADGFESPHRVSVSKAKEYVETISALREKYKDKIDIKIGFEMEFYPEEYRDMLEFALSVGAEYLILGQHFLENEHNPSCIVSISPTDSVEHLQRYVQLVIDAMETNNFTYIAHPDMFNFTGDEQVYANEMRKICKVSKELNIPLEINFLGIRGKRNYPNENFWKIAAQENSPVTFGFDAHDVQSAYDGESLIIAEELVKKYNLNYIGKPNLIFIN